METLFDLFADAEAKSRIKSLYQFDYRDLTALAGKHDLLFLETVTDLRATLAERDAVISRQAEQIAGSAGSRMGRLWKKLAGMRAGS